MKWLMRRLIWCALMICAGQAIAQTSISLETSDGPVPLTGGTVHSLPADSTTKISIESLTGKRVKYRLEGVDDRWRTVAGEASIHALFLDAQGNQIDQRTFINKGTSSGWNSDLGKSTFIHRSEAVEVPEQAKRMRLVFSSAGASTAVGVFLIDRVRVTKVNTNGETISLKFESRGGQQDETGKPLWGTSGLRPSMAVELPIRRGDVNNQVLALVDDDPESHADWQLAPQHSPEVVPGERLLIEWNEMFNIGGSARQAAHYSSLAEGSYKLRVRELDVFGRPLGEETVVKLIVPRPFWKAPWFLTLAGVVIGLLALGLARAVLRWKLKRQLEQLERDEQLANERLRIARDLHDDLGARITQLSLVSAMAESKAHAEDDRKRFSEVTELSRSLVSSLYETVWAVSPENDTLESLIQYLCQITENLCKPSDIRCRIKIDDDMPTEEIMHSETRHQIVLAVKEAVNNAVKHSKAKEVELHIQYKSPDLVVTLSDDGIGFEPGDEPEGHGIDNMKRRMAAINGMVTIRRAKPGTEIGFLVPLA
jgi:signal transduction histidine kinase